MTNIDDRIGAALDADDRAFLEQLDDGRGLFRQIGDSLGGPLGGWAKLVFAVTFISAIVTFYAVWQMFNAQETRDLTLWATAVIVLFTGIGFLKDWFFSRMNMLAILREVKRLELQIAMLSEKRD